MRISLNPAQLNKALIAIIVVLVLAILLIVRYCKIEIEAKVDAGVYIIALNAMRDLVFIEDGMKRGDIKLGCFASKQVLEKIRRVDECMDNRLFPACKTYAEETSPAEFLAIYQSMKVRMHEFQNCR